MVLSMMDMASFSQEKNIVVFNPSDEYLLDEAELDLLDKRRLAKGESKLLYLLNHGSSASINKHIFRQKNGFLPNYNICVFEWEDGYIVYNISHDKLNALYFYLIKDDNGGEPNVTAINPLLYADYINSKEIDVYHVSNCDCSFSSVNRYYLIIKITLMLKLFFDVKVDWFLELLLRLELSINNISGRLTDLTINDKNGQELSILGHINFVRSLREIIDDHKTSTSVDPFLLAQSPDYAFSDTVRTLIKFISPSAENYHVVRAHENRFFTTPAVRSEFAKILSLLSIHSAVKKDSVFTDSHYNPVSTTSERVIFNKVMSLIESYLGVQHDSEVIDVSNSSVFIERTQNFAESVRWIGFYMSSAHGETYERKFADFNICIPHKSLRPFMEAINLASGHFDVLNIKFNDNSFEVDNRLKVSAERLMASDILESKVRVLKRILSVVLCPTLSVNKNTNNTPNEPQNINREEILSRSIAMLITDLGAPNNVLFGEDVNSNSLLRLVTHSNKENKISTIHEYVLCEAIAMMSASIRNTDDLSSIAAEQEQLFMNSAVLVGEYLGSTHFTEVPEELRVTLGELFDIPKINIDYMWKRCLLEEVHSTRFIKAKNEEGSSSRSERYILGKLVLSILSSLMKQ
ncbi:hypothetical protein NBRC116602_24880 [Hyphomicrobiales bacterium 4NK60-0047b]